VTMGGGIVTGAKGAITLVAMAAALMAFIDVSIVTTALTDIRASFGTPLDQIGWVTTGYMMANIVVIPLTGWMQRRFGYRNYFSASIVLFTVASALCGLAWDLPSLVVFRAIQGLGGGAIIPTAQAIMLARYPRAEHGMAAGVFGLAAVAGPHLAPTIGGYLIAWSNWHWIFLVNVPIGIVVAIASRRVIVEPGFAPARDPIDLFGIGLLAVGMPSLQYVLEEGNRAGWTESRLIIILMAVAAIALTTFVLHELETEHPVVNLRVFTNASYAAGTGINFLTGMAIFGSSYLFALYCGTVMHYTALQIGEIFLLPGLVQLFLMPLIGKLSPKADGRLFLVIGITVVSASLYASSLLTSEAGFADLEIPPMMRSAGIGFIVIPVTLLALSDLSPREQAGATGLFALTRELGGSLGTAWMGMLVADGATRNASRLAENVTAYNAVAEAQYGAFARGVGPLAWTSQSIPEAVLDFKVRAEALVLSFGEGFRLTALVFAVGLLLVPLLKRAKPGAVVHAH